MGICRLPLPVHFASGIPTLVLLSPEGKILADSAKDYVTAANDHKTAADLAKYLEAWAAR